MTQYTPNYNLDLYEDTDKPNLRDQYNAAMGKIDVAMSRIDDAASADITTDRIADGAVTGDKIASGAVDTTQIADGAVTADKLADGTVTTDKIANGNVTVGKLDGGAVTTAKIADGAVTTAKIADSNVTMDKIADANVTTAKLNDGAVTTGKIANGNVTGAKLATGAVDTAQIADGAVTAAKIASGAVTGNALSNVFKFFNIWGVLGTPITVGTNSSVNGSVSANSYIFPDIFSNDYVIVSVNGVVPGTGSTPAHVQGVDADFDNFVLGPSHDFDEIRFTIHNTTGSSVTVTGINIQVICAKTSLVEGW